ncbi:hypothetical protein [Nocardia sp. NPDC059239]|uniref:hypothetical protein n=1 Tax=unclassified Nocardia TaxID=2637762 RepID=UPI00369A6DF6
MNLRQLILHPPRPGAPAADFSAAQVAGLTAEVARLQAELRSMQVLVDEVLDRESMHVYAPDMECLTTAAVMERLGTPRARHRAAALTEVTLPGRAALEVA